MSLWGRNFNFLDSCFATHERVRYIVFHGERIWRTWKICIHKGLPASQATAALHLITCRARSGIKMHATKRWVVNLTRAMNVLDQQLMTWLDNLLSSNWGCHFGQLNHYQMWLPSELTMRWLSPARSERPHWRAQKHSTYCAWLARHYINNNQVPWLRFLP